MSTRELQKRIFQNKLDKGWNVTSVEKEICLLHGEIAEFYEAYRKHLPTIGEELADIAIYLLGLAEILHVDLGDEIIRKTDINARRRYVTTIDGVNTRVAEAPQSAEDNGGRV